MWAATKGLWLIGLCYTAIAVVDFVRGKSDTGLAWLIAGALCGIVWAIGAHREKRKGTRP